MSRPVVESLRMPCRRLANFLLSTNFKVGSKFKAGNEDIIKHFRHVRTYNTYLTFLPNDLI